MNDNIKIYGVDDVKKLFNQVENVSVKVLTKAAKTAAKIVLSHAKANAPIDTGNLKKSMKLKMERRRKWKRVYDIKFVGENLAKESKSGKRSFYPASQEYGWIMKNGKKHPGKRFLRDAADKNRDTVNKTVLNVLGQELDKLR